MLGIVHPGYGRRHAGYVTPYVHPGYVPPYVHPGYVLPYVHQGIYHHIHPGYTMLTTVPGGVPRTALGVLSVQ